MRRSFSRNKRSSRATLRMPRSSIHRRDYLVRKRNRRVLSSLSISLLLLLSLTGLLISDYLGEEFALIMIVTPLFLMFLWLLAILFYKEEETIENSHHFQQVTGELRSNQSHPPGPRHPSGGEYIAENLVRILKNNNDKQSDFIISE